MGSKTGQREQELAVCTKIIKGNILGILTQEEQSVRMPAA